MVYDSEDGYLLYFGVALTPSGFVSQGQTWVLQGGNWTNLTPTLSVSPPGLQGAGLADDQRDGYVLLFGGFEPGAIGNSTPPYDNSSHPQYTWTFHAGRWTDRTTTSGAAPPGEFEPALTYDPRAGFVLLAAFNRSTQGNSEFETWSYTGGNWTNISARVGTQPGAREQSALVYDPADHESVLFGGNRVVQYSVGYSYNDTWAFRGGQWWNVTTPGSPAPPAVSRPGASVTEGGHVLLFGGYSGQSCAPTGSYNCSNAVSWVFLNGTWFNMSTELPGTPQGPNLISEPNMAWYPNQSEALLVSGGPRTVWAFHWNSTAVLPALALWRPGGSPGEKIPFTVAPLGGSPPYDVSVCGTNSTCENWTSLSNSTPLVGALQFPSAGFEVIYAHVVDANGTAAAFGFRFGVFNSTGPLGVSLQIDPNAGFSPLNVGIWVNISGGAPPVSTSVYFGDGIVQTLGPGSFAAYHNYTCPLPAGAGSAACEYEILVVARDIIGQAATAPGAVFMVCSSSVNGSVCYPPPGQTPPLVGTSPGGGRSTAESGLEAYSGLAFLIGGAGLIVITDQSRRRSEQVSEARSLTEALVESADRSGKVPSAPSREPRR